MVTFLSWLITSSIHPTINLTSGVLRADELVVTKVEAWLVDKDVVVAVL